MNYTKEIDSIIDWLTEEDGGHAVGEGNIKEAVNDLRILKQALNIDLVRERLLSDVNVEYKHETGAIIGKLKHDDDCGYLVIDYDGGTIHDPYIENLTVL